MSRPAPSRRGTTAQRIARRGAAVLALLLWAGTAAAQAPFWPSERPPRPLPAREVTFPPYEIRSLANGMRVITVLHHEQPAVTMRLLVQAGTAHDPAKKRGVAHLVGSLLDQGTTTKSAQEIADRIDSIGGVMATGSGEDFTSVSAVAMKDSFDTVMDLLADVVRNPAFSPLEIERQVEQAISTQQVNANDPDYVASVLFDRLVYGFHPYGLPGSGTPETLAAITRADLQEFHRRHFVPNNMVLAIVGDVTRDQAFAAAEKVFGNWPRGEAPPWQGIDPPEPTRRIVVVDKPDAVQTEIRVGQIAIPRKHPDFLAWDMAVKLLGGEGANRLHRVLRSERGLTYGASADVGAGKRAGDFAAETDTRTETTGEALRLMVEEFSRLQRQRVSERELGDAQNYLAGSFPLTIETPNNIATQVLNHVLYELPVEEIATHVDRLQAITPDDVQRVAQLYIKPDRLSIVLVGNARAFVPQLRSVGFTNLEIIPIEELDLMAATLRREPARTVDRSFGSFGPFETFGSFRFGSFGTFQFGSFGTLPAPFDGAGARRRVAYMDGQSNPGRAQSSAPPSPARPNTPNTPNAPNVPNVPNVHAPNDPNDSNDPNALLRSVIEAKGGLAALKSVRTVVADAQTTLRMQQGTLPSATRTYVVYPGKFRVDAQVGGAETTQVYNEGRAWMRSPAGVQDAPPGLVAEFAASVSRDTIPMLIAAAEGRLMVRALPEQKGRDGRTVRVLEFDGPGVDRVRLYVDEQMRIAGQAYTRPDPSGRQILSEEVFSDYREVNGVQVPFEAQLLQNGQPILTRTLTDVAINEPVSDALFARPTQ